MQNTKIEDIRKQKKMTIQVLCQKAELSKNTYHLLIKDGYDTKVSTLEAIAKALGVSISVFFDDNYSLEINRYSNSVKENSVKYRNKSCLECKLKDEALNISNKKLVETLAQNKLLSETINTLNRVVGKSLDERK
jgi:transcriptional regulator with XRE-family HTH domain